MNKKVLTLCAGVLLVSGSAVFTVNALNAGNEGVQKTAMVTSLRATEGVKGYELAAQTLAESALKSSTNQGWKVKYESSKAYLCVKTTDGSTWALSKTGALIEIKEGDYSKAQEISIEATEESQKGLIKAGTQYLHIDAATGMITLVDDVTEANAGIFTSGAIKTDAIGSGGVSSCALVVVEDEVTPLSSTAQQKVVAVTYTTTIELVEANANPIAFFVETEESDNYLYTEKNGVKLYLGKGTSGAELTTTKPANPITLKSGDNNLQTNSEDIQINSENIVAVEVEGYSSDSEAATSLDAEKTYYLKAGSDDACLIAVASEKAELGTNSAISDLTAEGKTILTYANGKLYMNGYLSNLYLACTFDGTISFGEEKDAATVSLTEAGVQVSTANGILYLLNNEDDELAAGLAADANLALYPVTVDGVAEEPVAELNNGQYVLAEKKVEKAYAGTVVKATAQTQESTGYASEYGQQDDLLINRDGSMVVVSDVNDMEVPADMSAVLPDGTEVTIAGPIVVEDGYIKSLSDYKADPYEWTYAEFVADSDSKYGYRIEWGKKSDATKVQFKNGDLQLLDDKGQVTETIDIAMEVSTVTMPAAGWNWNDVEKGVLICCNTPLFGNVPTDQWVLLGGQATNGEFYYITRDGKLTQDIDKAELWKVDADLQADGRMGYTFQSAQALAEKKTEYLTIDGAWHFLGNPYAKGMALIATDNATNNGPLYFDTTNGVPAIDNTGVTASTNLGLYRAPLDQFDAQWLLHHQGSFFNVNITEDLEGANTTVNGDEFNSRDLVPYIWYGGELVEIKDKQWYGATNLLLKIRNKDLFIVLDVDDKWSDVREDLAAHGGYKFTTLSTENLKKVLKSSDGKVDGKGHEYYPYFRFNYNPSALTPGEGVTYETEPYSIEVANKDGVNFEYVIITFYTESNNHRNYYVTVNDPCTEEEMGGSRLVNISFHATGNIVEGTDTENNPLLDKYVNIEFKAGENMQFQNSENEWVNLDGKVLGIGTRYDDNVPMPAEDEQFLFAKPEGQWVVTMTDAGNLTAESDGKKAEDIDVRAFTFTNRENPNVKLDVTAMHYMGNHTYAVEFADNFAQFGAYRVDGKLIEWGRRDTLVITPATINKEMAKGAKGLHNMDGYANWTKEELQNKTFQLSVDAISELYVTENEGKDSHFLGLSVNEADVTNWRLVAFTEAREHDTDAVKYLTAGTDSVYIMAYPQSYSNGVFTATNDTTAIITYALQNIQNSEWLTYDPTQNQTIESMICDPNSKKFTTDDMGKAYRFVLKQKDGSNRYNILGVESWGLGEDKYVTDKLLDKDGNEINGKEYYTLDLDKKLYGATTAVNQKGAIEVSNAYDKVGSNDIFKVISIDAAEYVNATPGDTVRFFRQERPNDVLFENGQFLNYGNIVEDTDMAPAMVLDTAYYNRPNNNRYQYLLMVNPDYRPAVFDNAGHRLQPDTMYGRFLINQIDSAVLESKNHNNKFINDVEADRHELKLGFQWGYRTADKLVLTDGKGGEEIEVLDLSTPDFNKAKFAFKYVDENEEAFKIQTAWFDYDAAVKAGIDNKNQWVSNNEGYLKTINGVVVVTDSYTNAEEFLMAQEESNPTANESINANGAVSVVATDGAVVIKGAEGKNVVIATILGKVVANETINSDNETIAVPAGIAVVSVDGESFKVVVK